METNNINAETVENISTNTTPIKKKNTYTTSDLLLTIMVFLCSYFYVSNIFLRSFQGYAVTIFTFLFCATAIIFFKSKKIKSNKTSNIILGYIVLLALNFSLFENTGLAGIGFVGLTVVAVYWVYTYGKLTEIADEHFIKKTFSSLVVAPFRNFFTPILTFGTFSNKSHNKKIMYSLAGFIIALPIIAIASGLLLSSSEAFTGFINIISINLDFDKFFADFFFNLFFTLPICGYLFSLIYASSLDKKNNIKTKEKTLPKIIFNTALSIIVVFYFLYFFIEITDFIFNFSAQSPNSEYSSMAVESFSSICQIAILNFIIFLTFKNFVELKNNNFSKLLLTIIGGQTFAFICFALVNLIRYFTKLGLTYKRVNSFWFLIVMAFTVICFSLGIWVKFNYTKASVIFIALSFIILFYSNQGALIAQYNIKYCTDLDRYSYNDFGIEAVPTLLDEAERNGDNEEILKAVEYIFEDCYYSRSYYPLRGNVQYEIAKNKAIEYSLYEFDLFDH